MVFPHLQDVANQRRLPYRSLHGFLHASKGQCSNGKNVKSLSRPCALRKSTNRPSQETFPSRVRPDFDVLDHALERRPSQLHIPAEPVDRTREL